MKGRSALPGEFVFIFLLEKTIAGSSLALSGEFALAQLHDIQMKGRFALSREFIRTPCMLRVSDSLSCLNLFVRTCVVPL